MVQCTLKHDIIGYVYFNNSLYLSLRIMIMIIE